MFRSKATPITNRAVVSRSAMPPECSERKSKENSLELLKDGRHLVSLLSLPPGAKLTALNHLYAAKYLTVLQGCAAIHKGGKTQLVHEGSTCVIAQGISHIISNAGKIELRVIEVRSGAYVKDDDLAQIKKAL